MGVTWWSLQSQLLVAIQNENVLRAKQLLDNGVDCDARFAFGSHRRPAICVCVERDSLDLVRLLLESGCSVNQSDTKGRTALHLAAGRGQAQLLELLLRNKASVRALDEQKRTALHWAAMHDSPTLAELLLQHSANANAQDQDGTTPLLLACQNRSSSNVAKLLLRHGSDARIADHLGNTALHFATDPELIEMLVAAGGSVNSMNHAGLSPLHVAVRSATQPNRSRIIKVLARAGCDLDQPTPLGQTALHTAVQERDEASAMALLRLQARADKEDKLGLPPLFYAAKDGNLKLVKALLAAGAYRRLGAADSWTKHPHFGAQVRDSRIVQLLSMASSSSPPLVWLARNAFREQLKENSVSIAAALKFPRTLIGFLDFSDIDEDWF